LQSPVVQWQILAKEPAKAEAFYTRLFDWRVDADNPLQHRRLETGSKLGIQGGIWPAPEAGHSMVQLFIQVGDAQKYSMRTRLHLF
jgi:predicted enzyme related to lactoylglutathione lyase